MNHELLDSHQLNSQHLKLVAKIALLVSAASCVVLLIMLMFITNDAGESYGAIVYSHSLTNQRLEPAMLVAALVLVTFTGIITWVIALYKSFRVAGPLYRFTQNFKLATANASSVEILPIRESDDIQNQAKAVKQAIIGLRDHYAAIKDATREASSALAAGDAARYTNAVALLGTLDEKTHI